MSSVAAARTRRSRQTLRKRLKWLKSASTRILCGARQRSTTEDTGEAALVHQPEPRRFFLRFLASSTSSHDCHLPCGLSLSSLLSPSTHESNRIESNRVSCVFHRDKQDQDPLPCLFSFFCATPRGPFEPIAEYSSTLASVYFFCPARLCSKAAARTNPSHTLKDEGASLPTAQVMRCQLRIAPLPKSLPGRRHTMAFFPYIDPAGHAQLAALLSHPSRSPSLHSHSRYAQERKNKNQNKNSPCDEVFEQRERKA